VCEPSVIAPRRHPIVGVKLDRKHARGRWRPHELRDADIDD
jgi:hypothetical protein